jgi:hypothetical protein
VTTLPELGGTSWKVSALTLLLLVCARPQEPKTVVPALGDCTWPPFGVRTSQPRKVVCELPELGARVNVTGAPAVREVAPPGACVNIIVSETDRQVQRCPCRRVSWTHEP